MATYSSTSFTGFRMTKKVMMTKIVGENDLKND
jgi:hypothetical protein